MGSPESDGDAAKDEKPQRLVGVTEPFYLGVYEVAQVEYQKVTGSNLCRVEASQESPSRGTPPQGGKSLRLLLAFL